MIVEFDNIPPSKTEDCDICLKTGFISITKDGATYFLCLRCIDRGSDINGLIKKAQHAIANRLIAADSEQMLFASISVVVEKMQQRKHNGIVYSGSSGGVVS